MPKCETLAVFLLILLVLVQLPARSYNIEITRGLTYSTVDNAPLLLDLYLPQQAGGKVPAILALHGSTWASGTRGSVDAFAVELAMRGYAVIAPDFRLAPQYVYPAQLEDVRAAARWVQAHADAYHFDMRQFHLFGFTAGGHLAGLCGVNPGKDMPHIASVITIDAPMDFTAPIPSLRAQIAVKVFLDAEREEKPERYAEASPIFHVTPASPPFLLIHGTNDPYVPVSQSTAMAEALRKVKVPVTVKQIAGAGDTPVTADSPLGQEMLQAVLAFLQQMNKTIPPPSS